MATETIPKQCKAGVVVNEGPNFKIEVQLVDVPTPAPDEVLLRLNATGLCMSDVHFMLGDWGLPPMSTFGVQCAGHEGAGVVVAVGDAVKDWKVGDRGGVKPLWDVCGNCELCYTGRENYCQKGVYTGLMKQGCVSPRPRRGVPMCTRSPWRDAPANAWAPAPAAAPTASTSSAPHATRRASPTA